MWLLNPYRFALWTPAYITTALWLDAADSTTLFTTDTGSTLATNNSAVGRWVDKSGGNWNATQATAGSRPTFTTNALNGKSVVKFNGTNTQHFVHSLSVSPAPHTVYAVARRTTGGSTTYQNIIAAIAPSSTFGVALSAKVEGGGGIGSVVGAAAANWGTFINTTLHWTHAGSSILDTWSVIGIVTPSAASGTETFSTNGSLTTVSYASRYGGDTNNRRAIGGDPAFNSGWLWGDIGEIIVLSSAASTDTRQRIEGYLAHKWGLTANLPSDHPYKNFAPRP